MEPIARWAAGLGFIGLQVPVFDDRLLDLRKAAESAAYCEEITAMLAGHGVVITELASQWIGHLVAIHKAYDPIVDVFAPPDWSWALEDGTFGNRFDDPGKYRSIPEEDRC